MYFQKNKCFWKRHNAAWPFVNLAAITPHQLHLCTVLGNT